MQLIDHVSMTVVDLAVARPFYVAIFKELGADLVTDLPDRIGFGTRNRPGDSAHTYLSIYESAHARPDPRRHWCFRASSIDEVKSFHDAGLAAGGTDAGAPGLRTYHSGYYAAFLCDPEGNKVEAVYHRDSAGGAGA